MTGGARDRFVVIAVYCVTALPWIEQLPICDYTGNSDYEADKVRITDVHIPVHEDLSGRGDCVMSCMASFADFLF
jgi:hypothetical protein